ncbi:TetR family transcriptional regulator [Virgisporangium aliadipatigenens]|uniref:TetR family transcriptional regulator n=2 Tax=Virgisporangium aliadipatigenens TaxID=741659 RepID=A0A8J3YLM7_9ACTN|nr:TetR family transcriptional regulator [Virgisporangium aliadipatigenens]
MRYREQVRDEVKEHAWAQVATSGASALSLNAIAKQMGISGPALYRYFRNRDELITELVLDAYRDLAATARAAATPKDPRARLTAVAAAMRAWALEAPHRYLLIYGTPVPGYAAPPEATEAARDLMSVLLDGFTALPDGSPSTLNSHLDRHRAWSPDETAAAAALRRALVFWTRLHGVVSLEVAGHFTGMGFDPQLLFAAEVAAAIDA